MPQPDYEDDLVFPPQERLAELSKTVENLSSENHRLLNLNTKKEKMSLTEKWKKQMLESGYYVFKEEKGSDVQVGFVTLEGDLFEPVRDIWFCSEYHPNLEIVAPCDYDELQRLKKGWELYSHETVITKQLRQLLKECQTFFEEENPKDFTVLSERMEDLLTKIEKVLK